MKSYKINTPNGTKIILADELEGTLVWPKSKIPFFDHTKLKNHPDRKIINGLIAKAEKNDEEAITKLWKIEYLEICYKV
jgi:hypothetical protein